MSDPEKKQFLDSVRDLCSTIQNNTKREFEGKDGNANLEARHLKKVLSLALGREPNLAEISIVSNY